MIHINDLLLKNTKLRKELDYVRNNQLINTEEGTTVHIEDAAEDFVRESKMSKESSQDSIAYVDVGNWEQGDINGNNGINQSSTNRVRTIDYFEIIPGVEYTIRRSVFTSYNSYRFYDKNKNYIGIQDDIDMTSNNTTRNMQKGTNSQIITINTSSVAYMRIVDVSNDLSTVYTISTENTPSPNYPQEIKTVKGYRNLFDKDNANVIDGYIASGDNYINYYATNHLIYINCESNTTYTIQKNVYSGSGLTIGYTTNIPQIGQQIISRDVFSNTNHATFTTPANANYIVAFVYNDVDNSSGKTLQEVLSGIQITEGTEELPYVPYGTNWVYKKIVGKNLFDKDNANILDAYIDTNGNILSASNGKLLYINCKSNTTYTISKISGTRFRIVDTNVLPEIGIKGNNFVGVDTSTSLTITTANEAKYLCVNYYNRNTDTYTEQEILNSIQIEEGSATSYESYKENIITLPLNGNEIAGTSDYKDEYIIDKNGHCWLNKKTVKKQLVSTANITNPNSNFFMYYTSSGGINNYLIGGLCNFFKFKNDERITDNATALSYLNDNEMAFRLGSTKDRTYIKSNNFNSVNDFKSFLNDNEVILYYVLATPELIDLNYTVDLTLFEGVNNISNSDDMDMTITYVQDIREVINNLKGSDNNDQNL